MVSSLVIQKNQKGIDFTCSNHSTRIVETGNARFIENDEVSGSAEPCKVEIKEVRVRVPLPFTSFKVVVPEAIVQPNNQQEQQIDAPVNLNEAIINEPRSRCTTRSRIKKISKTKESCYF
mgnify:CR=1 FL=1